MKQKPTPRPQATEAPADALIDAMGGMLMCLVKHLPPHARAQVSDDLAAMAKRAKDDGRPMVGNIMEDLSRAAGEVVNGVA